MSWLDTRAEHTELGETWAVGRPALVFLFYGYGPDLQGRSIDAFNRFLSVLPQGTPLYFLGKNARSYKRVTTASERRIRADLEKSFYTFTTDGEFRIGEFSYEASLGNTEQPDAYADHLFMAVPATWGEPPHSERVYELFRSFATDFPFWGGICTYGFDMVWGLEYEQSAMHVGFRLARRYRAVLPRSRSHQEEILYPYHHAPRKKRLPAAGWLTFLGAELLANVGGRSALEAALDGEGSMEAIRDGLLVRTGPTPPLCDANRPDPADQPYIRLSRAIRDVRLERWGFSSLLLSWGGIEEDEADQWLHRFDE